MDNYLEHHGIMGMKWGVRRFQPYGEGGYTPKDKEKHGLTDKQKKAIKIGAAVVVTATVAVGAAYVGKKLHTRIRQENLNIAYSNGMKEVQRLMNMMKETESKALSNNSVKSHSYTINSDKIISDHVSRAQRDSFGDALKNVVNFKKSKGTHKYTVNGQSHSKVYVNKVNVEKVPINKTSVKTTKLDSRGIHGYTDWYRVKKRR